MGDGKVNKYAVVINKGYDAATAKSTRDRVQEFRQKGYVTFAASDKKYPVWADMYVSNSKALKGMIDGIKAVIDDDDQLKIVVINSGDETVENKSKFANISDKVMQRLESLQPRSLFTKDNYEKCYYSYHFPERWMDEFRWKKVKPRIRTAAYWCMKAAKNFSFVENRSFHACWDTMYPGFSAHESAKRCVNLVKSGKFVFADDPIKKVSVK